MGKAMTDSKRENRADSLRALSLTIEKAAYDLSDTLSPNFTSELIQMSARLVLAADAVGNAKAQFTAHGHALDEDCPNLHGRFAGRH